MLQSSNGPPRRPGRGPVLLSVALHASILTAMAVGNLLSREEIEYVAFEMQMISEADLEAILDPPPMPVVESQPEPEPEPEPPPEPEEAEPEPEPEPEESEPEPESEPEEPEPAPDPVPEMAEPVEAEASPEAMAVRMEGLRRDFPAYYAQILREVGRCFRWTAGGRWEVVLRFDIQSNGGIPGRTIEIYQRSGNSTFDIDAFGAVECAGRRLEPLPEELGESLSIQLRLTPQ